MVPGCLSILPIFNLSWVLHCDRSLSLTKLKIRFIISKLSDRFLLFFTAFRNKKVHPSMFRNIDGAIRDGFTPFHPRDPSIPLRSTRDDSCLCHLERSDSVVERSRPIGAFSLTIHTRSAQPAKDKRLSAVLRPGWLRTAGAKRRIGRLSC